MSLKKKDQDAIAGLYMEGFDNYESGHNGSTDGGQYDGEGGDPESFKSNIYEQLVSLTSLLALPASLEAFGKEDHGKLYYLLRKATTLVTNHHDILTDWK